MTVLPRKRERESLLLKDGIAEEEEAERERERESCVAMSSGVTFNVAEHGAESVKLPDTARYDLHNLVWKLKEYSQEGCGRILQGTPLQPSACFQPCGNGFVWSVFKAYSKHHNLIIRPDDVWLAIVIQFGLFINANAEALRSLFVSHDVGKKELIVHQMATLNTADYSRLATDMVLQLQANLKDPGVCDWVLPRFSTTTCNDTIVGSIALMGTLKQYFTYRARLACGIPQVTLTGTVDDWEEIHLRVDKLSLGGYGKVCSSWACLLKKITAQFVETSQNNIDLGFWSQICHYRGGGSGSSYLSGWITAFCAFDGKGQWQATNYSVPGRFRSEPQVSEYPVIDTKNIPQGYITVDLTVEDNMTEFKTLMFAGHMGYDVVQEGKGLAPKLAWAIALKSQTEPSPTKGETCMGKSR